MSEIIGKILTLNYSDVWSSIQSTVEADPFSTLSMVIVNGFSFALSPTESLSARQEILKMSDRLPKVSDDKQQNLVQLICSILLKYLSIYNRDLKQFRSVLQGIASLAHVHPEVLASTATVEDLEFFSNQLEHPNFKEYKVVVEIGPFPVTVDQHAPIRRLCADILSCLYAKNLLSTEYLNSLSVKLGKFSMADTSEVVVPSSKLFLKLCDDSRCFDTIMSLSARSAAYSVYTVLSDRTLSQGRDKLSPDEQSSLKARIKSCLHVLYRLNAIPGVNEDKNVKNAIRMVERGSFLFKDVLTSYQQDISQK
ncbi:hypothetical protein GEMRC1_004049 [Eukaryota sp. GEM-RC1]